MAGRSRACADRKRGGLGAGDDDPRDAQLPLLPAAAAVWHANRAGGGVGAHHAGPTRAGA
eukprot:scaffold909_cov575-Prasinococcus_capsulatus_cf.AAC.12